VGTLLLALSAAWQLFDAIVMSVSEALRAAGDTAFSLWARLLIAWLLFVPGSWLAVNVWGGGAVAAILAIVAYLAVLAGVLALRFRSGAWRRIALTEDPI
jgi:MATE family multidrug resistance protein